MYKQKTKFNLFTGVKNTSNVLTRNKHLSFILLSQIFNENVFSAITVFVFWEYCFAYVTESQWAQHARARMMPATVFYTLSLIHAVYGLYLGK